MSVGRDEGEEHGKPAGGATRSIVASVSSPTGRGAGDSGGRHCRRDRGHRLCREARVFAQGAGARHDGARQRHPGPSVHQCRRGHGPLHQCRVPGHQPVGVGREPGLRRRHRVLRAKQGDQAFRQADQRRRWHLRPQDQSHDRDLRSHRRGRHAGPVQAVDRGRSPGVRRARRGGHVERRQSVVHYPRRAHAAAESVDDGDELD